MLHLPVSHTFICHPQPCPSPAAPVAAAGWDPSLLRRCEQQEALISSVEGLQQSREYRKHIK